MFGLKIQTLEKCVIKMILTTFMMVVNVLVSFKKLMPVQHHSAAIYRELQGWRLLETIATKTSRRWVSTEAQSLNVA